MAFRRVTIKRPCVICGKPDFCTYTEDGIRAKCMRVESDKPSKDGGFFHVTGVVQRGKVVIERAAPKGPPRDWSKDQAAYRLDVRRLAGLAKHLGVSAASLELLGTGWDSEREVWTFPMYDERGVICGFRTRDPETGDKKAITGSHQGFFCPSDFGQSTTLFICEGPTDAAAVLSAGFAAIGRPSCIGCEDTIARFLAGSTRHVCIVPDGAAQCLTARKMTARGVERLHDALRKAGFRGNITRLSVSPHKDVREWWRAAPHGLIAALTERSK